MSQLSLSISPSPEESVTNHGLLTVVIPPLEGEFLYTFDPQVHPSVRVGDVIEVSLGRRVTSAFVISVNSDKEAQSLAEMQALNVKVKRISTDAITAHAFNEEHVEFFRWIAKYYAEPLSKIIDLAVPVPSLGKSVQRYHVAPIPPDPFPTLTPAQQAAVDHLRSTPSPLSAAELNAACGASASVLKTLVKKGVLLCASSRQTNDERYSAPTSPQTIPSLNEEQRLAIDAVREHLSTDTFAPFLLQGVTGSGKTEVYLELIHDTLHKGRSALVIVPEIALTPQLTDRFAARLHQPIAVLHSSLTPRERWRHWSELAAGDVRVAIGARSAIFAPMRQLGLIVVDEEHDSSFKQGEGIRYHGRDLAVVRGKLCSCPVVLGSATPSLETFHHASTKKYHHLTLTKRFFESAPSTFEIVDLNSTKPWLMPSRNITPQLLKGLSETLDRGEQAFILFNKRGFASYLQCSSCEHVLGCPHCSVTLTYHRNNNSLLCHQCNFSTPPPLVCVACGATEPIEPDADPLFAHRGSGTERVHEEIAALIPKARVAKLDRDSASTIEDYVEILGKVRAREIDILVGTQMIAKGHDLPNVTFVGIVDCDVGLHMPDFRAAERSFHLLTQVAGRAGRRLTAGRVVLQTRVPKHPSLVMTATADYTGFARGELRLRHELGYPPFQKLLRIIISAEDRSEALSTATTIARWTNEHAASHSLPVLGPAPAPMERVRNMWRYHILVKSPSMATLQHVMQKLKRDCASIKHTRVAFDLDPHDML